MEQQLFCSLYNVNSSFVAIVQFFVASVPNPALLYLTVMFPPVVTLDTLLRINEGRCPKCVGTIKGVLRKPPGLSRKQPSPPFQSVCDILFAESTEAGSHDVDTTVKRTPRRLALHSFMMKSCATIHPHMCSSNI